MLCSSDWKISGPSLGAFVLHLVLKAEDTVSHRGMRVNEHMSRCNYLSHLLTTWFTHAHTHKCCCKFRLLSVSVCFLWVRLLIPFWFVRHCWRKTVSLFSLISFPPVHPLIQNRAICHVYHPSLHSYLAFLSVSLQILASQTSSSRESLWPRGVAAHHTPPLKCLKDSNTKGHSWTSG